MEIKHTRKSLATLLTEAGAPAPAFDPAAGALRYIVDGEPLAPGEAAKRFLPRCGKCGVAWPPCDHKREDPASSTYRTSDYLAMPDVWGDERGNLVTRTVLAEAVEVGDLYVFQNEHGHAYKVNSIDRVPMPEGPELIRFSCTGGATAGAHPTDVVQILTPDGQESGTGPHIVRTKHRDATERTLLGGIPLPLAEQLVISVMEIYGDTTAWIEAG